MGGWNSDTPYSPAGGGSFGQQAQRGPKKPSGSKKHKKSALEAALQSQKERSDGRDR